MTINAELADYPEVERRALQLTQLLKDHGKEDGVVHSAFCYIESVILRHVIKLFRAGKLYGGRVDEVMKSQGFDNWTEEQVVTVAAIQAIEHWSSKELGISLPTR